MILVVEHVLRCDIGDDYDGAVHAGHVLDEPVEFEAGTATVNNEADARAIVRRHTHVHYDGTTESTSDDSGSKIDEDTPLEHALPHLTVDEIEAEIERGRFDGRLDAVEQAEREGKARKGVFEAIEESR